MNKYKFMKWAFGLTALASAIAFVFVGIYSPIEPGMSIFGHVMKCIFGWLFVTVILETLMYSVGQIAYHWVDDYKDKYGKRWFIEGIKDDLRYIKEQVTWKKVLKTVGIYVAFFAACLVVFYLLELLVP